MKNKNLASIIESITPTIINPSAETIKIDGTMKPPSNDSPALSVESRDW